MRPLQEVEQLPIDTDIDDLDEINDLEIIDLEEDKEEDNKKENTDKKDKKPLKAHIIRRNVEDYLEKKALERRLSDVFDGYYY